MLAYIPAPWIRHGYGLHHEANLGQFVEIGQGQAWNDVDLWLEVTLSGSVATVTIGCFNNVWSMTIGFGLSRYPWLSRI